MYGVLVANNKYRLYTEVYNVGSYGIHHIESPHSMRDDIANYAIVAGVLSFALPFKGSQYR